MWFSNLRVLDHRTTEISVGSAASSLSLGDVIHLWEVDEAFRSFFTTTLKQSEFDAFFWETPPMTRKTLSEEFKCVLVSAPTLLQLRPNPSPFSKHFSAASGETVLTFANLGGDAMLVVPTPLAGHGAYTHLAQFLRQGPLEQVNTLWQSVGLALKGRISNEPVWASTAGLGVSWLHVRLDSHPKYYRHTPYTKAV